MRLRWPQGPGRAMAATLAITWLGVAMGRLGIWWIGPPAIGLALVLRRWRWVPLAAAGLLAGVVAGSLSLDREEKILEAALPEGSVTIVVRALMDPVAGEFGDIWFLARPLALGRDPEEPWRGPPILVSSREHTDLAAGEMATIEGRLTIRPGWARGSPYAGRLKAFEIDDSTDGTSPVVVAGNAIRDRVIGQLDEDGAATALLSGFLVGATDGLPAVDMEALRRTGLAHYVAVSGSNVAGFLMLWWLVLGPVALGRRRGLFGLAGLVLFVIATRWEPSVMRAALMAGTVLVGRTIGWPIDSWTALGASGTLALLVSPELAGDVGFQLSVLATAGILTGSESLPSSWPRWLAAPLGATLAAQVAVLPLLLVVFGTVPLLSPLTNLVAAPLVAAATVVGGVGSLIGLTPLTQLGVLLAGVVLEIARWAHSWPQIGPGTAITIVVLAWVFRYERWRPVVAVVAALVVAWPLLSIPAPPRLAAVFIDVGQGDAILLIGATGQAILVDGGPDPVVLVAALDRYSVDEIALLVITHAHQDHAGGALALPGRHRVARLWYPGPPHTGPAWEELLSQAGAMSLPVEVPRPGQTEVIDGIRLRVLGPLRRYDDINDQSVVLTVDAGATRLLLTGDIEVAAQADLGMLETDVLKVPHHGAITSDLDWLAATDPLLSIVSVGENDYGHPAEEVLAVLEDSVVARTDWWGDIVVPLMGDPLSRLPAERSDRSP